jgi:DNA polymerase-1
MSFRHINHGDHMFVIDASGFVYRAYHAFPKLLRAGDHREIGAIAGFASMICGTLNTFAAEEKPTHLALIFDYSSRTWRNEVYPGYKANRSPVADELRSQFKPIRDFVRALGLPMIEQQGYEADDILATYATLANENGASCTIVSGDKDLMQLVTPYVGLIDPMKKRRISADDILEKWGVPAELIPDVQALMGDSTDNVPGMAGIGAKGASEMIAAAGSLVQLLAEPDKFTSKKKTLENLRLYQRDALLSYDLVRLMRDVPLDTPMEDAGYDRPDFAAGARFLREWGCNQVADEIEGLELAI